MRSPVLVESKDGFTLIELLVVIGIISVLAGLLLPAISSAKARTQCTQCLSNLRQLQHCWQMYVDDYQGRVPPNLSVHTNGAWRSTPDSWIGSSSALVDIDTFPIEQGLLFKYDYNRSTSLYICPADHSRIQNLPGRNLNQRRTRSYSMSGCLGGRPSEVQSVAKTENEIPQPSRLFVFLDEHQDSIDDAHFLVWPAPDDRWVNLPAERHGKQGTFSFADGHAEAWKWKWSKTFKAKQSYWKRVENNADRSDLQRLQEACLPAPANYRRQP